MIIKFFQQPLNVQLKPDLFLVSFLVPEDTDEKKTEDFQLYDLLLTPYNHERN